MRTARLVLAVSLLVGWTASAGAEECAWILWKRTMGKPGFVLWMIENSFEDRQNCIEGLTDTFKEAKRTEGKHTDTSRVEPLRGSQFQVFKRDQVEKYICQPGTIHPRDKR